MSSNCKIDDPIFNLSAPNPKFFKIILQDTISQGTLALPKKFVIKYGDRLSSPVILKLPYGKQWKMELSKGGIHEAWLQKALETADTFSSRNPWFKVVLKSRKNWVPAACIPMGFVRDHTEGDTHTLILNVGGSKSSWPAKLIVYGRKCFATFSSGWTAFVTDNCLKTGDVCVFESVGNKTLKAYMDNSDFAQGDATQFFKFFLEETISQEKLMLPRKFAAKHGNFLPSSVTLELPTGAKWEVELLKNSTREIWFDKGWKEFAQHCSLAHGNVLVFHFDKNSLFHVQVFEGTGLQIDYPDKPAVVHLKMEEEDGNGVTRGSKVKIEVNESIGEQVNSGKTREGVKNKNKEKDVMGMRGANRVKRASEGEKDGGDVCVQPVLKRAGKQGESASELNNGKTSEDEDEIESDSDSADEDYVQSIEDGHGDDVQSTEDDDGYVEPVVRKSGGTRVESGSKPNNGRGGKRVKRDVIEEDVDEDYIKLIQGMNATKYPY